ncbi:DUF3105 domain-containing protein [Nocardioides sp. MAHUQ-72]|uniref:DUF3105 domain-containing protein n=1 Tax=unclassified Nocardioides TaxID=2615069 RepID=UPI003608187C
MSTAETAARRGRRITHLVVVLIVSALVVGYSLNQQARTVVGLVRGSETGLEVRTEPCLPGRAVPVMDSPHRPLEQLRDRRYTSRPPTSGPHFAIPPQPGIYTDPLPAPLFVHAEEHGHVVIAYRSDLPAEEVDQLSRIAREHLDEVVLTPYDDMSTPVALAAWGRLETMSHVEPDTVEAFVAELAGRYDHGWARPPAC